MRFIAVLLAAFLVTGGLSAQKSNIKAAKSAMSKTPPAWEDARKAIDAAISDSTTISSAEAWYLRGQVYSSIGTDENTKNNCSGCLETAYSSFLRAEELDSKKEYVLDIESFRIPALIQAMFDRGVSAFSREEYAVALSSFEAVIRMAPQEMSAVQNAAFSAENAGDLVKAEKYYRQLIGSSESSDKTFSSLAKVLLQQKDTAAALNFIKQGRSQYPDSVGLLLSEINIYLASGDDNSAVNALEEGVRKDPGNASLYLAMGSVYESLARPSGDQDYTKPTTAAGTEYLVKARKAYEQGLAIDSMNFDLNFNLGAFLFNRGTELENLANAQKSDADFQRIKAQGLDNYKSSEPYFLRALTIQPGDESVLNSLKMLYFRTKEDSKYNDIKSRLDNLQR